MSHHKRKRDDFDDSDDEEPSFGRQILPVANLPENYDGPIFDGSSYLFTVRRDARRLPHVVRAANPYEFPDPPEAPSSQGARHPALPSYEWRLIFERRFKNFRKNIVQPTIHVQMPAQNRKQKIMPDRHERDLWWEFFAGKPESVWGRPKKPKSHQARRGKGMRAFSEDSSVDCDTVKVHSLSHDIVSMHGDGDILVFREETQLEHGEITDSGPIEVLPTPRATPVCSSASDEATILPLLSLIPREPTPSLLNRIDHSLSVHLLTYFLNWINHHLRHPEDLSSRLTEIHARWIFALLSRVEDYVPADDMSILRNLARACIALLKELVWKRYFLATAGVDDQSDQGAVAQELMSERSCWMVIAAIVDVWAQRDLWTDAEAMLASIQT